MVTITTKDEEYFTDLEVELGRTLTAGQRAWYCKFRDSQYAGSQELMWREMPSTPDEAFKVSMEGAYFKDQFKKIRQTRQSGKGFLRN